MDQVTQQNAAMVEQSTAATHSLSQETEQLSGLIGQFQIGRTEANTSMRRELQKVAPHAFRPEPKAAPPTGARAETRKATARPVRCERQGGGERRVCQRRRGRLEGVLRRSREASWPHWRRRSASKAEPEEQADAHG